MRAGDAGTAAPGLAKMLPGEGDGGSPGFSAAGSLMFPAGAARADFEQSEKNLG